jgi:hypothetical protein
MYYMFYIMKKQILTVRDVEEAAWRRFRAVTAEEGLKAGDALTQAMKIWIKEKESRVSKPDPKLLLRVKQVTIGKKKVKWSQEIDETLYGL